MSPWIRENLKFNVHLSCSTSRIIYVLRTDSYYSSVFNDNFARRLTCFLVILVPFACRLLLIWLLARLWGCLLDRLLSCLLARLLPVSCLLTYMLTCLLIHLLHVDLCWSSYWTNCWPASWSICYMLTSFDLPVDPLTRCCWPAQSCVRSVASLPYDEYYTIFRTPPPQRGHKKQERGGQKGNLSFTIH